MPGLDFLPFLDRLAGEGLGAEAASRFLRTEGRSFTQATFREYYRSAQLRQQLGGLVEGLPDRIPIPLRLLSQSNIHGGEPFMSRISATGTDLRTGEESTRYVMVLHDKPLSKSDAVAAIYNASWFDRGESLQGFNVRSFSFDQGFFDPSNLGVST